MVMIIGPSGDGDVEEAADESGTVGNERTYYSFGGIVRMCVG